MADETTGEEILLEKRGAVAWVTLNRPHRLNAMNMPLLQKFTAALDEVERDNDIRVMVIRGAGRAFSAGFDLTPDASGVEYSKQERTIVEDYDAILHHVQLFERLWDMPKPNIVAIHGYCLAGATQMCTFADITVAAENARIGWPKIPVGGGLISPMWSYFVGPKRAKQMSFTIDEVSGTTASEWGWVNYAVPEDELWDNVEALAKQIARMPAEILRMKKYAINRVAEIQGFKSAMSMGAETDALLHFSPEVLRLKALIKSEGLKGAIAKYNE